jgi:hypothetical protein
LKEILISLANMENDLTFMERTTVTIVLLVIQSYKSTCTYFKEFIKAAL